MYIRNHYISEHTATIAPHANSLFLDTMQRKICCTRCMKVHYVFGIFLHSSQKSLIKTIHVAQNLPTGSEEHIQCDLFCVKLDDKLNSINPNFSSVHSLPQHPANLFSFLTPFPFSFTNLGTKFLQDLPPITGPCQSMNNIQSTDSNERSVLIIYSSIYKSINQVKIKVP